MLALRRQMSMRLARRLAVPKAGRPVGWRHGFEQSVPPRPGPLFPTGRAQQDGQVYGNALDAGVVWTAAIGGDEGNLVPALLSQVRQCACKAVAPGN